MKKTLVTFLCLLCCVMIGSTAMAYPNEGKSYDVTKPAGREYFPSDISQLPVSAELNDLFEFLNPELGTNGRVVTKEDWAARRAEIADLVQYYYLGYKQPVAQENVKVRQYLRVTPGGWSFGPDGFKIIPEEIYEEEAPFLGNDTQCGGMYITVTRPDTGVSADVYASGIYVPQYTENAELQPGETNVKGPYPVILGVGGGVSGTARNEVLKRGYALVNLNTASVYTDTTWNPGSDEANAAYRTGAYTTLYPFDPNVYEYNSGALMGWAWGISRIIDAISNGAYDGMLDAEHTVITGVSRNGKAALIAGAFDERISIVAPADPGQTGTSSYRYTDQAQLFNYQMPNGMNRVYARNEKPTNVLTDSEAHWVNSKAEDFRNNVTSLPFDAHSVEALVAPRPLMIFTGEEFDWLGSPANILCETAAAEVYDFLGVSGNIGVRVHDGAHALQDRDVPYILAIMDREFRNGGEGDLTVEDVYPETDPPSNGAGTYKSIADFSAYPYEVDSSYIRWSNPDKYVLWVEQELLTAGRPGTVIAHTDAAEAELKLPDGTALTAKAEDGVAKFELDNVIFGRYAVSVSGEKEGKTVYFQAMSMSDALRHGMTSNNTGGNESPIYGFTSRVDADALEIYADGRKLETSVNEGAADGYVLDYGAMARPTVTYDVLTLKNLKLAALPGYTAEISFDKALYQTLQPEGSGSDDARERPSWAPTDSTVSANALWPVYPNNLADDGERKPLPPTPTAFDTALAFSFDAAAKALTVTFSEPVNSNEFGIAVDFAEKWDTVWAEDGQSVTLTFDAELSAGQACSAYVFRLRDAENNMIGQNGIAGPVGYQFTIE